MADMTNQSDLHPENTVSARWAVKMKKDFIYSIRMSSLVREGLSRAAKSERRSMASLLDKIILDYLEAMGFLRASEIGSDRRRYKRKTVMLPATTYVRTNKHIEAYHCVIVNLSLGGALVGYPKGCGIEVRSMEELSNFELGFNISQAVEEICFPCQVQRMNDAENGILMGAMFRESKDRGWLQHYLT